MQSTMYVSRFAITTLTSFALSFTTLAADRPTPPEKVIRFHGHEYPGVTMGYRMATEAMEAMPSDAKLIAIAEHRLCRVDALQWVTGCTAGKADFRFKDYGKLTFALHDADTRKGVRILFHRNRVPTDMRKDRSKFITWLMTTPG